MIKLISVTIVLIIGVVEGRWKPDPLPEGGTDHTVFNSHPIVLNARKMSKLMVNQDVVTTCRYMLFKNVKKFHDANEHCENVEWPITHQGVGMATVQNEDENNDIVNLLKLAFGMKFDNRTPYKPSNWVYIGLSKRRDNNRKLKEKEKGIFNMTDWYYTDNSVAQYGNFRPLMPDQQVKGRRKNREYQNWIQVNKKGYWDDTFSSRALPFACQYCGKYIVLSRHVKWDKAKEHCEDFGLKFATVNNEDENKELLFAATITLGEELGGRRFNNSNWVWIGEEEEIDENNMGTGVWRHYDGNDWPLEFKPRWDRKRQPDNRILPERAEHTEQRVVAISRKDGKWDDSFKHKRRPFACMCPDSSCRF